MCIDFICIVDFVILEVSNYIKEIYGFEFFCNYKCLDKNVKGV